MIIIITIVFLLVTFIWLTKTNIEGFEWQLLDRTFNYKGIKESNLKTLRHCKQECHENKKCVAYTFNPSLQYCYHRHTYPNTLLHRITDPNWTSGIKLTKDTPKDYDTKDPNLLTIKKVKYCCE